MPRVAIIVVTHQSAGVIGPCLESLARLDDVEVVVVDNASSDDTVGKIPGDPVRVIANGQNLGFGAAVNQGVHATSAPLILLLNPDARLEDNLERLIACFEEDARLGAAGGQLVGPDGLPQTGFMARNLPGAGTMILEILGINRLWPGNPANWHYRCLGNDPMVPAIVDQPAGAFFMFRRSAWIQVEGFDEQFWPVWFEDVDFCARLKDKGFKVLYEPAVCAFHQGGHSVNELAPEMKEKYWYGSLLKYAAKHYQPVEFAGVCVAVMAGAAGRAAWTFPRLGLRVFTIYGSVIRQSFAHLRSSRLKGSSHV